MSILNQDEILDNIETVTMVEELATAECGVDGPIILRAMTRTLVLDGLHYITESRLSFGQGAWMSRVPTDTWDLDTFSSNVRARLAGEYGRYDLYVSVEYFETRTDEYIFRIRMHKYGETGRDMMARGATIHIPTSYINTFNNGRGKMGLY